MTWPDHLVEMFKLVERGTTEKPEWYGPYNSLLQYLFPPDQHYMVTPQCKGYLGWGELYGIAYVVKKHRRPVFFIEIKPMEPLSTRRYADKETRRRFQHLVSDLDIPKLFGISAIGTNFAVYEYDKETTELSPEYIPSEDPLTGESNCAPAEQWAHKLLEAEGEAKIREIVEWVKDACNRA